MRLFKTWMLFWAFVLAAVSVYAEGTLPATITWQNTNITSKIQIEKAASTSGPFTGIAILDAGTSSYVDATNAPGEKACYRMAYFNTVTLGSYTTPKCKTFSTTVPPKPLNLTVN